MNDNIKKIAVDKLLDVKGKNFIQKNKNNFVISYSEDENECIVTFLLSPLSNVNNNVINNSETPIKNFICVTVDKKTNKGIVSENTL